MELWRSLQGGGRVSLGFWKTLQGGRRVWLELWRSLQGNRRYGWALEEPPRAVGVFGWSFRRASRGVGGSGRVSGLGLGRLSVMWRIAILPQSVGGLVCMGDLSGYRLLGFLEPSGFLILSRRSILWALFLHIRLSSLSSSLSTRFVTRSMVDTWEGVEPRLDKKMLNG